MRNVSDAFLVDTNVLDYAAISDIGCTFIPESPSPPIPRERA